MWYFIGLIMFLPIVHIFGANVTSINIFFLNDRNNQISIDAIQTVVAYIKNNSTLNINITTKIIHGDHNKGRFYLEELCKEYNNSTSINKTPPHLLFDTTQMDLSQTIVKVFSASLGIPIISASSSSSMSLFHNIKNEQNKLSDYQINFESPIEVISAFLPTLIEFLGLSNAAILYDNIFSSAAQILSKNQKKLFITKSVKRFVMIIQINDNLTERHKQIDHLVKLNIRHFFILSNLQIFESILESTKDEYFTNEFAWFGLTQEYLSEIQINCSNNGNKTIILIRPALLTNKTDKEKNLLWSFYNILAYRSILAVRNMLQDNIWPVSITQPTCNTFNGTNAPNHTIPLRTYLADVSEPGLAKFNDDPMLMGNYKFENYLEFELDITLVHIQNGHVQSTEPLAIGMPNVILNYSKWEKLEKIKPNRIYRVLTVLKPPFIMRDEQAPKKYTGFCIDMIEKLARMLNFDYEIKEAEDNTFGFMNNEGKWNGIVKELINNQADIALGGMVVMSERTTVIDFTVPYYDLVGINLMMAIPKVENNLFKFLTILDKDIWICILGAYFLTSSLLWIFNRWSPYSYQNNPDKFKDDEDNREFHFRECLWFCLTSLTPQGGGYAPKCLSGRLVTATWWLFGFIILASYTANLAVFLTVSRIQVSIESIDDLLNQKKIQYAPQKGSMAQVFFERMSDIEGDFYLIWRDMSLNKSLTTFERTQFAVWEYPVSDKYTRLYRTMQQSGMPTNISAASERIRSLVDMSSANGFVFLGDALDIRYQVATNCHLEQIGEELAKQSYAIGVQKGSILKKELDNALLELLQQQWLEQLKIKWWSSIENQRKCPRIRNASDGISILNIGGVFMIIFIGIGISILVLIVEFVYAKFGKTINQKCLEPMNGDSNFTTNDSTETTTNENIDDHEIVNDGSVAKIELFNGNSAVHQRNTSKRTTNVN